MLLSLHLNYQIPSYYSLDQGLWSQSLLGFINLKIIVIWIVTSDWFIHSSLLNSTSLYHYSFTTDNARQLRTCLIRFYSRAKKNENTQFSHNNMRWQDWRNVTSFTIFIIVLLLVLYISSDNTSSSKCQFYNLTFITPKCDADMKIGLRYFSHVQKSTFFGDLTTK